LSADARERDLSADAHEREGGRRSRGWYCRSIMTGRGREG